MSLLDDVSIVVTPNGYKAGELYAVIPVPTEGSEQVTDGGFPTGTTAWTYSTPPWSISGDSANCDGTQGAVSHLYQVLYTIGNSYKTVVSVIVTTGTLNIATGTPSATITITSSGTYEFTGLASSSSTMYISAQVGFVGSIENVSVKEYTSADMDVTRATAATRVDENGLVNYAEILGGDVVTNGNFTTDLSGWTITGNDATHTVTWTETGARYQSDTTSPVLGLSQTFFEVGKIYTVTCNIAYAVGSGALRCSIGGVNQSAFTEGFNTRTSVALSYTNLTFLRNTTNVDAIISNVIVKEVTRDNVPRIDYTGGGCPHILAEPQRTNEYKESTNIDNWTFSNATGTSNYSVSPDGTQNASRLLFSGSGYAFRGLAQLSGVEYTVSVYAKRNDSGTQSFGFFVNGSGAIDSQLNITSEWKRFTYTYTTTNTYETGLAGDSGADISFYGYQKEQGSYATSLIPTSGSAVTRNQDIFTRDGIGSLINSTEGVLFVEMAVLSDDSTLKSITLSDGTGGNRVIINYSNASNRLTADVRVGAVGQAFMQTYSYTITNFLKIALKYKENDFALWVNGTEVATDTSGSTFSANTLNRLGLDNGASGELLFGKVKQLKVFKTALTDSELIALTT